ncbi:TPA: hypothetical protein DCL37_08005 [Candidatus Acetothermia bacterium]|nr:hypothetical protein [Candidatus Acetothermia bacterium]
MARMHGAVGAGGLLMALWLVLWRELSWPVLASGALFPLGFALLAGLGRLSLDLPFRVWYRLDLWAAFLAMVALRVGLAVLSTGLVVLRGREAPGIVAVPVRLRSGMGRLFLLWAITITPGTIALLMEGELLYVHCLRRPEGGTIPGLVALEEVLLKLWG